MSFLLPLVFFLCIHHWNDRGCYAREISYQDTLDINNGSCYSLDSCQEPGQDDPVDNYEVCRCHSQCWENGTCCNYYRGYPTNQKCVSTGLYRPGYYAISVCPDNTHADSVWKISCENEWNGEDDILMLSPVTSLATSKTYKNYYCFKCHETTDEYLPWNLRIENNYDFSDEKLDYRVAYDSVRNTWMANLDNPVSIPVTMYFEYPENVLKEPPIMCDSTIISDCAVNWTDARIRDKCLAYTAVVYSTAGYEYYTEYKNVHCALCNYKTLDHLECKEPSPGGGGFGAGGAGGGKGGISLQNLVDINSKRFDKPGSDANCEKDHYWDPYKKECRKLICALPGYVLKDYRCVPP